jgi:microcystin degradation protein MlrC
MVRALLPQTPLGASFDLHGNMPPEWAEVLDIADPAAFVKRMNHLLLQA